MTSEFALLGILAFSVKVITVNQVERLYFSDHVEATQQAQKLLRSLSRNGDIELNEVALPKIPILREPLFSSTHSTDAEVKLSTISWKLQKRLSGNLRPTFVAKITRKGVKQVGGRVPKTHRSQLAHDLLVTETALHFLGDGVTDFTREDFLAEEYEFDSTLPDAFIPERNLVIDAGGPSYRSERLEELIYAFEQFEFQLW